jgi:hypothetical protein
MRSFWTAGVRSTCTLASKPTPDTAAIGGYVIAAGETK